MRLILNRTLPHPRRNRWLFISLFFAVSWLSLGFDRNIAAPRTSPSTDAHHQSAGDARHAAFTPTRRLWPTSLLSQLYPCHGDVGQGLTDEWRDVWEEDHRNCWASGCHGGRAGDEGFPVPHIIPAVIGAPPIWGTSRPAKICTSIYSRPTRRSGPGVLSDADYHNVTALLWQDSGRTDPEPTLSPTSTPAPTARPATNRNCPYRASIAVAAHGGIDTVRRDDARSAHASQAIGIVNPNELHFSDIRTTWSENVGRAARGPLLPGKSPTCPTARHFQRSW